MKLKVQMIGVDLDGTLLTTDKKLLPYTASVLKAAAGQGKIVLPVTGRPLCGVPEELLALHGIRYVISANGGRIVDRKEEKILHEDLLPAETARRILNIMGEYDAMREVYYDGIGYAPRKCLERIHTYLSYPSMAEYVVSTRIPVDDVMVKFEQEKRGVDKLQGLFAEAGERDEALERIRQIPGTTVTSVLEKNIEVNAGGVNKGKAVRLLARMLEIPLAEVLVFGDAANDIQMVREAGIGVAVANAVHEVKEAADYVTGSNDEEGAAKFIEKYVL